MAREVMSVRDEYARRMDNVRLLRQNPVLGDKVVFLVQERADPSEPHPWRAVPTRVLGSVTVHAATLLNALDIPRTDVTTRSIVDAFGMTSPDTRHARADVFVSGTASPPLVLRTVPIDQSLYKDEGPWNVFAFAAGRTRANAEFLMVPFETIEAACAIIVTNMVTDRITPALPMTYALGIDGTDPSQPKLLMLSEYVGTVPQWAVFRDTDVPEKQAAWPTTMQSLFLQGLAAIQALACAGGIVHGDLHLANVRVDTETKVAAYSYRFAENACASWSVTPESRQDMFGPTYRVRTFGNALRIIDFDSASVILPGRGAMTGASSTPHTEIVSMFNTHADLLHFILFFMIRACVTVVEAKPPDGGETKVATLKVDMPTSMPVFMKIAEVEVTVTNAMNAISFDQPPVPKVLFYGTIFELLQSLANTVNEAKLDRPLDEVYAMARQMTRFGLICRSIRQLTEESFRGGMVAGVVDVVPEAMDAGPFPILTQAPQNLLVDMSPEQLNALFLVQLEKTPLLPGALAGHEAFADRGLVITTPSYSFIAPPSNARAQRSFARYVAGFGRSANQMIPAKADVPLTDLHQAVLLGGGFETGLLYTYMTKVDVGNNAEGSTVTLVKAVLHEEDVPDPKRIIEAVGVETLSEPRIGVTEGPSISRHPIMIASPTSRTPPPSIEVVGASRGAEDAGARTAKAAGATKDTFVPPPPLSLTKLCIDPISGQRTDPPTIDELGHEGVIVEVTEEPSPLQREADLLRAQIAEDLLAVREGRPIDA